MATSTRLQRCGDVLGKLTIETGNGGNGVKFELFQFCILFKQINQNKTFIHGNKR
jgi:hypothetical protein